MKRLLTVLTAFYFLTTSASAAPIGHIDRVSYDNGVWKVMGWACDPATGNKTVSVSLYVANAFIVTGPTDQPTEQPVVDICTSNGGTTHRFTLTYTGAANGQSIKVLADGVAIHGSDLAGLPDPPHPREVMSAFSKLLLVTAHPDDELLFAPMLGELCPARNCRILVANNGGSQVRVAEMAGSAGSFPMSLAWGNLSHDGAFARNTQEVLDAWSAEGVASAIQTQLVNFAPDVILTLDPRHGTSCHPEHRAIGKAVFDAVSQGGSVPLSRLFFLTTRREGDTFPLRPNAPYDKNSVVYRATNQFTPYGFAPPGTVSGWDFAASLMYHHESQFAPVFPKVVMAGQVPEYDRNTAFRSAVGYQPFDPLHDNCDKAYRFVPYHTAHLGSSGKKCLDVAGGPSATGNHAGLQQWDCQSPSAGVNQVFWLHPTDETVGGRYYMQMRPHHSGKCVDIVNAASADGAGVQQYSCLLPKASAQEFDIRPVDGLTEVFEIRTKTSGATKCLDVQGGASQFSNGAVIQQYSCLTNAPYSYQTNQLWKRELVPLTATGQPQ